MEQKLNLFSDTIAAVATPPGSGGIAVIRVSGPRAVEIVAQAWHGRKLETAGSHTAHLGEYRGEDGRAIDQCVATLFRAPASFTGEDVVELSLHGSRWIQKEVLNDLIRRGARAARPGEFSQRAFINGRIDLTQAESIADLIAASSRSAHDIALNQLKGSFSGKLKSLRESLVELASLLELELDFSEEDVEFADRNRLLAIAGELIEEISRLADSFSTGRALKDGVGVVIAGVPNAGKSTLLNNLLEEDRAIVSDVAGTTRDVLEDTREFNGILFRFFDTAGLRESDDEIERIGIERAKEKIAKASFLVWMFDVSADFDRQNEEFQKALVNLAPDAQVIRIFNKTDLPASKHRFPYPVDSSDLSISGCASSAALATKLASMLVRLTEAKTPTDTDILITNTRHYEALLRGKDALQRTIDALSAGLSADLVAQDLREATHHLGTITGAVTTDTLLHSIFSRFCIGK